MASFNSILGSRWTRAVVFSLCLTPIFALAWWVYQLDLTGNPIEFVTHYTGDWTIRFLMITLAVTPLRALLNRPKITAYRRMLGLFAFFYGSLHFIAWILFTPGFSTQVMLEDIFERPYITVGMAAFLVMLALALTSSGRAVRAMGFKRWQLLHRLIYAAALLGVIHYFWLVKSDITSPTRYAVIFGALMLFRVVVWVRQAKGTKRPQPVAARQT